MTLPLHAAPPALLLGIVLGVGIAYVQTRAGAPQPTAALDTSPQPDPAAVPLPRFTPELLAQLQPSSGTRWASRPEFEPVERAPRPAAPDYPEGRPPEERPAQAGHTAEPRQPRPTRPTEPAPELGSSESELPPVEPVEPAEPSTPKARALAAYDEGVALYRRFIAGEGSRSETGPRARKKLEEAVELLESAALREPGGGAGLKRRVDECLNYLGFLNHYSR